MIKIMFIVSSLINSGPTRQLLYLVRNLDRKRIQPSILKLSSEDSNSLAEEFEALNISIFNLNSKRRRPLFNKFMMMKKIINENKPDIVHTFGYRCIYYVSRIKVDKTKKIAAIRANPTEFYHTSSGKFFGKFMVWYLRKMLKKMDVITSCSITLKDSLQIDMNINSIAIPNGIDQEVFFPMNRKKELREKLSLPLNQKIFISVGRVVNSKNYDFLCEIWSKSITNSILIILGEGELLNKLREKYKNMFPSIIFLGEKNNVAEYLNAADYFVSSSLTEGLPNSVLEALATGLPVLLSNIPAHKEFFNNGIDIGNLYKNNDAKDFLNNYNTLLQKEYSTLSSNCISLVNKYYSAKKNAEEYEKIYFKILTK